MSSSIPPDQRAKSNLQPSTSIGVGVDMSSSNVNASSLKISTNKKWKKKKKKSHLYNKTINMPRIQDIHFFFF